MVDFLKGRSTKLELAELRKITNHYHWLHTFCFVSIPLSSPGDRISQDMRFIIILIPLLKPVQPSWCTL